MPALVAHAIAGGATGGTTGALNTTGATLLVVAISYYNGAAAPTVSDSKGNAWTALTLRSGLNTHNSRLYYCANPTVGAGHTFTVAGAASQAIIAVQAFSNTKTAAVLESETGGAAGSAVLTVQPGSITPAAVNAVLVSAVGLDLNPNAPTINSGFTRTDMAGPGDIAGSGVGLSMAYLVQNPAAAVNPAWTWGANDYPTAHMASFKAGP